MALSLVPFERCLASEKGNARDEEEQWEDRVVVEESVPFGVAHLRDEPVGEAARPETAERNDEGGEAHDEEHVEAPERVERQQPLRGGGLRGPVGLRSVHALFGLVCLRIGIDEFVEPVAAADRSRSADGAEPALRDLLRRRTVGTV